MKRRRQKVALFVKGDGSEDGIGSARERAHIPGYPVGGNLAVSVGRQYDPSILALLLQPSCRQIHRGASCTARVSARARQRGLDDSPAKGKALEHTPRDAYETARLTIAEQSAETSISVMR